MEKKKVFKVGKIVATLLLVVSIGFIFFFTSIDAEVKDTSLAMKTLVWANIEEDYEDINSITYRDDLSLGKRTFGFGSLSMQAGDFKNEEFGAYKVYAFVSCKEYIVLDTKEGIVVVNENTSEKTKALYNQLQEKMK